MLVNGRKKHPDLKIDYCNSPIYLEAKTPSFSEHQKKVQDILTKIDSRIRLIADEKTQPLHIEMYLFKEPNDLEIIKMVEKVESLWRRKCPEEFLMKGLTKIFVSPIDHEKLSTYVRAIEEKRPRLASISIRMPRGYKCTIEIPFSDERAKRILRKEYLQLSRKAPGVIFLDLSQINELKRWTELIKGRLQPKLHRRISAVLITQQAPSSKKFMIEKSLVIHPNPYHKLPQGFLQLLSEYE